MVWHDVTFIYLHIVYGFNAVEYNLDVYQKIFNSNVVEFFEVGGEGKFKMAAGDMVRIRGHSLIT